MNTRQNRGGIRLLILFTTLLAIIIIDACRKIDKQNNTKEMTEAEMRHKFFTIKPGTDPIVVAIAANVKRQDEKRHLVSKLAKRAGYPLWDKARITLENPMSTGNQTTEDDQQIFIPLVQQDSTSTEAILAVKISGTDTLFRLEYGSRYTHYGFDTVAHPDLNAKTIFHWFTLFDHEIFGHEDFNVSDGRLLEDTSKRRTRISNVAQKNHNRGNVVFITIYVTYMFWDCCPNSSKGGTSQTSNVLTVPCQNGYSACNVTYAEFPITYWFVEDDPEGNNGWYGPSNGGGGGAGVCPGCNWEDTNPCELNEQGQAITLCNETWEPTPYVVSTYDPDNADSVRIDDEILDSFPCTYHLIKDTLFNINKKVQHAMQQFFTVNMYNHVYFEIDWTLDCNSPINAWTKPDGVVTHIFGETHWTDTIKLNPCFLRTASKEKIVQVLVHEPIHAFISWCIKEYKRTSPWGQGLVDSNYLKEHFGIYWEWINQRPYNHEEDHTLMVSNFLDYMSDIVLEHSNPNSPIQLRRWVAKNLAATGLRNASAWGVATGVTDTCNIYGVDYWSRFHKAGSAPNNPFNWGSPCRTYDNLFRDSLQMLQGDSCQ